MLDRFLKLIIAGTLALFFIQAVIGALAHVVEAALHGVLSTFGTVAGFLGQVIAAVAVISFLIGLLVRALQFLTNRNPRGARERATRDRAMRQRVRRPVEGVPPVGRGDDHLRDPDPAVNEDREGA